MNYLIGSAPGIQSLLQWAEYRGRHGTPLPIIRADVDAQITVNGVDPTVFDGRLWAFANLNLTGQAKEVSNNVPGMRGLEVWRSLVGNLFTLTDLLQLDLQTLVYAPAKASSLPRVRSPI